MKHALALIGWLLTFGSPAFGRSEPLASEPEYRVEELRFVGLDKSDAVWLTEYLDQPLPARLTASDALAFRAKLMTTAVFKSVESRFVPLESGGHALVFEVEEKWTTIPVIRGAFGGGTPLTVLGAYDIHAFGRLVTLGGEARKYGDAPPGFVLYFRDPRAAAGRYFVGAEFWRSFRRRHFFDLDGEPLGKLTTNATIGRFEFLRPLADDPDPFRKYAVRYGLDLRLVQEAPAVFDPDSKNEEEKLPTGLEVPDKQIRTVRLLPQLVYDDVDADNLHLDGLRLIVRVGPEFETRTGEDGETHTLAEVEAFRYWLVGNDLNLALHGFVGQTTSRGPSSLYYLGGFDSVRGMPDGVVFGQRAAYLNAEMRHLTWRFPYLWVQNVAFFDAGWAGGDWQDLRDDLRRSVGAGFRLSVPQVHRLVFRIDYAWSVDGTGTHGISAGMNQLFDPYRPL